MSNRSTSSTVPPVSGVYSGLGASVALIRFGDEPADWAASDLFLDVVGLAEGPDWAGAVRSTTAGADAGGLADEWREERRSMFAMIDVAAGECGADSEARLGEGEAIGDVERVVGINGAEVGTAGKKKDETRPINGGLAIAAVVNMSDGGENAGRRSSQTEGYGRAWGGMRAEFEAAVDDGADDGCRALHDDGRDGVTRNQTAIDTDARSSRPAQPDFPLTARRATMLYSMRTNRRGAELSRLLRFQCRSKLASPICLALHRTYTSESVPDAEQPEDLLVPAKARFNEVGVQQLSSHVYSQVFTQPSASPPKSLVELSKDHLSRHDLWGKNQDDSPPISFNLPPLQGKDLDEHFFRLGMDAAEPYLDQAKELAGRDIPQMPRKWVRRSGWTKYYPNGRTEQVDAPQESMLVFDTEVMWKESSFAVMACAASPTAWYAWLSPWLLGESESDRHLIPLGDPSVSRIVVGHNVGYDRARTTEEYRLQQSRNFFIDTMSLHVAVNGMCSRQRPTWMKHRKNRELREKIALETDSAELAALLETRALSEEEEELWVGRSSVNSLRDVAKFHCDVTIDKAQRDQFGLLDREGVREKLEELMDYCAADVAITHRVYQKVLPGFLEVCPHPVSFGALRHLSSVILPVDRSWESYLANAEATYHKLSDDVHQRLIKLTGRALEMKSDPEKYNNDPWLKQLDWSGQEVRMVKGKKKGDPPRPAARQKMPGMPKWYKDLFATNDSKIGLSVRTRIAPLMLRLSWDQHPLVWSDKHGWTFRVPITDAHKYNDKPVIKCDTFDEGDLALQNDRKGVYFKLPHKDGPAARCTNPLAKGYLQFFENGTLSSEYSYAKEALEMNASCSYWISARDRIMSQMVVYEGDVPIGAANKRPETPELGLILPQVIPMGTITRRAVENTWLTASNAKPNRVGSELKSMIKAPPGYCFVGADVDSQELWIASLVGDAQFKLHGGNAIGFMTLEGTKAAGTDLHSKTAKILGISRDDAKVFNYGRIYGAGIKFASTLLRQFNPALSEARTAEIAARLYRETKGQKTNRKSLHESPFWRGGTESFVFNKLEEFAEQERPRTPVLGAGITEALMRRYINKGGFMTSRINWAIQSSGVDYLHLLIISMDHLIRRFNLDARLAITVHDEIRYLVSHDHRYKAALALQVSNLWTRAMFSQQMGIHDLPQSCAYFSAVDIDHVLRKEVDMDCFTPSHPHKIPHGESLDVNQILAKGSLSKLDLNAIPSAAHPPDTQKWTYTPRRPVMESLLLKNKHDEDSALAYLKAQITSDEKELRDIVRDSRKAPTARTAVLKQQALPPRPHQQPQMIELPAIHGWVEYTPKQFSVGKKGGWVAQQGFGKTRHQQFKRA